MKSKILGLLAVGLLAGPMAANAVPSIANGSLTGPIANGGVPPGWTVLSESPDTMDANNNVGVPGLAFGAAPNATPDGGTWVGLGREGNFFIESFGQSVAGFDVGTTYSLNWFAGNFGEGVGLGYIQPNAIEVLLDGISIGSGGVLALGSNWFAQGLSFVATSATQQLAFRLALGNKSYLSIDGISIGAANGTVPEPGTLALLGLGLAGLGLSRRRKA